MATLQMKVGKPPGTTSAAEEIRYGTAFWVDVRTGFADTH